MIVKNFARVVRDKVCEEIIIIIIFLPSHVACGILVPQAGIKSVSPAVKAQSLNHWTSGEVGEEVIFNLMEVQDPVMELGEHLQSSINNKGRGWK